MTYNYHAHTWRCSHATGTEEEYIQMMGEKIGAVIRKNDLTLRYNYFKE